MIIYSIEYDDEIHHFQSFEKMMKAFKSWWKADGRPFWYDENGKRTHFPTVDEVLQGFTMRTDFTVRMAVLTMW